MEKKGFVMKKVKIVIKKYTVYVHIVNITIVWLPLKPGVIKILYSKAVQHVHTEKLMVLLFCIINSKKVAWPSGLRRWFKAPVSSEAWVRIPPLPTHFFCSFSQFVSFLTYARKRCRVPRVVSIYQWPNGLGV